MSLTPGRSRAVTPGLGGEKKELQGLNSRLQAYIFRVRDLLEQNEKLEKDMCSFKARAAADAEERRGLYEKELGDTRQVLDETARERAELQIAVDRLESSLDQNNKDLETTYDELRKTQDLLKDVRNENAEKSVVIVSLQEDLAKAKEVLDNTTKENEALMKDLEKMRNDLESESLLRVDLQNSNQSLKEQIQFNEQVATEEIKGLMKENKIYRESRASFEVDLRQQHNDRLEMALAEAREQHEKDSARAIKELEITYAGQVEDLNRRRNNDQNFISVLTDDNARLQLKFDDYKQQIKDLETKYFGYEQKMREMEDQVTTLKRKAQDMEIAKDNEIVDLKSQLSRISSEYESLLNVNTQLDAELESYNQMLDGEEQRLGIGPSRAEARKLLEAAKESAGVSSPSKKRAADGSSSPTEGRKRRREENELQFYQISTGDIAISNVVIKGDSLTVSNLTNNSIALGGWVLQWHCGDKTSSYKFGAKVVAEPMCDITVYTSDGDYKNRGSKDLYWKHSAPWKTSGGKVNLIASSGETVAEAEVREGPTFQFTNAAANGEGNGVEGEQGQGCIMM
eukprot:Nk52_evm44s2309 gene=Nk52_evmTU44s2309